MTFRIWDNFFVGIFAMSCVVTDVTGDGIPDIVTENGNFGGNSVHVFVGQGNGSFISTGTIYVGSGPRDVEVADVNGDGKPDLIVPNWGGATMNILLGNGDGTFRYGQILPVGTNPNHVAASDVNGDGVLDLVVANSTNVGVLIGNGDGTFQPEQTFATGAYTQQVRVVDVNGDNKPDILAVNTGSFSSYQGSVGVLMGNGNGTFAAEQTYLVGHRPTTIKVADFDGDGKVDIVVSNNESSSVSILLGNGDGTFQNQRTSAVNGPLNAVDVGDFNGDGRPDMATANGADWSMSVLLSDAKADFAGQVYTITPGDVVNGMGSDDTITLIKDVDGSHIDWTMGTTTGVVSIGDPNGLTII